jgi:6-pyruvoyltetrahydropterin/6-carboxytetrahydropterin synthase
MYTITKQFSFSASHRLNGLPANHQCARLHGHNYTVEVVLKSKHLDAVGFVRDYGELAYIGNYIDAVLDHKHLNDCFDFNPTAENLAEALFDKFRLMYSELVAVRISETPRTWAEYRP